MGYESFAYKKEKARFAKRFAEFRKQNKGKYAEGMEMRKAFLDTFPEARPFSAEELSKIVNTYHLAVPVERLMEYGYSRRWLTRTGRPFKSAIVFANAFNSVYLQEQRKLGLTEYQAELFGDDIVSCINDAN